MDHLELGEYPLQSAAT